MPERPNAVRLYGDTYKRQGVSGATVSDTMAKFNTCVSAKQNSGITLEQANSECINEIAPAGSGGKSRKSRRGKSRRGKSRRIKRRSSRRRR